MFSVMVILSNVTAQMHVLDLYIYLGFFNQVNVFKTTGQRKCDGVLCFYNSIDGVTDNIQTYMIYLTFISRMLSRAKNNTVLQIDAIK